MRALSFTPLSIHAIQRTITTSGDIIAQAQSYRRPICDSIVSAIFSSVNVGNIPSIKQTRDIKHKNGVLHLVSCLNSTLENHLFTGIKLLYTTEYTHHAKPNYHGYCIIQNGPQIYLHRFEKGIFGKPFIPKTRILLLDLINEVTFKIFKNKLEVALANNRVDINPLRLDEITSVINNWIGNCLQERNANLLKFINEYNYNDMNKIMAQDIKGQFLKKLEEGKEQVILKNITLLLTDKCPITLQSPKELLSSEDQVCALRKCNQYNNFYLVNFESLKRWINEKPINPITRAPITLDDIKFLDYISVGK